jgi:hypothetical protein
MINDNKTSNVNNQIKDKDKLKNYYLLKHLTIAFDVLFLITLIAYFNNLLPAFWNIIYFFYVALAVNTGFLALKINKIPEEERDNKTWIYLTSHLFILILIVIAINQFLKRPFVISLMPYLIGFAIASGFLTFFTHKDKVEKEMEEEKEREEKICLERDKKFDKEFYTFKKIPLIGRLLKFLHREPLWYGLGIILIAVIFIAIKIGMPIVYMGSYFDEYSHILSGIEFFKTGHFPMFHVGLSYTRGAYVSVLVGLYMWLFGQTIFATKMVPATIGIINFFLLYAIARKVIAKKEYILLLMLIYTISPLVIFNHFYIRMYVFYEFFILLTTLFFILILKNICNLKKFVFYLIINLIILITVYLFSYDVGKYLIILYSLFFLFYIYFFIIQKVPFKNRTFINFNNNHVFKLLLFLLLFILSFFYIGGISLIETFTFGNLAYTSTVSFKYDNLFFNLNIFFSILFLISFSFLFFKKMTIYNKLIIFSSLILFLIHYNSSLDLQLTRAIIYLLPLFYLISVISISKLSSIYNSKLITCMLIFFLFFNIYSNYPANFLEAPYIPTEVGYIDNSLYSDVLATCNGSVIITASYPGITIFHEIKTNYFLNIQAYQYPEDYEIAPDGKYVEVYSKVPVLTSYEDFSTVLNSNQKVCFFGGELSRSNIGQDILSLIKLKMKKYPKEYTPNLNGEPLFYVKS